MPYKGYARTYVEYGTKRREVTDVTVELRSNGYEYLRATTVEGTIIKGHGTVTQREAEDGALLLTLFCAPVSFVVEETAGFSTRYYDDGEIIDGTARPAPPMLPDTTDDA
jgi:hypothetical protein